LSSYDTQIIKVLLNEQSKELKKEMSGELKEVTGRLKKEILGEVRVITGDLKKEILGEVTQKITENTNILKIYMDTQFKEVKASIVKTKNEILADVDTVLQNHEKRIKRVETELHFTS
jgi:hypothetical protein